MNDGSEPQMTDARALRLLADAIAALIEQQDSQP